MRPEPEQPLVGRHLERTWAKAQRQDPEACERLATYIIARVTSHERHHVRSHEQDDLVQEVVHSILEALSNSESRFACPTNLNNFIKYRSLSKAKGIWQRRSRTPQAPDDWDQDNIKDEHQIQPWVEASANEEAAAVRECLEALADLLKECLKRRYDELESARAIAISLSISHTTVNRRLEAGHLKLSDCLDAKGVAQ